MSEISPDPPARYENYPDEPIVVSREPRTAPGVGRGALTGMAAAALAVFAALPMRFGTDLDPGTVIFVLSLYAVAAATVVGAAPGAAVGGLLTVLARGGVTRVPIRLLGGLAAAATSTLASAPLLSYNWSGVIVATLCGTFAAPWVAWGPDRPTLD